MDQGLVIAILVAVIVLLIGLLALLVLAAAILAYNNRQQDLKDEKARKYVQDKVRKMSPRDVPSPTPISRTASPPPRGLDFLSPTDADEAATEVMTQRQAAALFDGDENTGTTEVKAVHGEVGHLQLDDTDETTETAMTAMRPENPGRVVAEKK